VNVSFLSSIYFRKGSIMVESNQNNPPASDDQTNAIGFGTDTQIGLCFRTGADPNPYQATQQQCIDDGGQWQPLNKGP
jgi:hypothetical protein